jgi:3-demethoxyubiquinol 3-hydroxylase
MLMERGLDHLILEFDKVLRILHGEPAGRRPNPADAQTGQTLDEPTRRDAAALMRVNHCGEVCAQALYRGQALGSSNDFLRDSLAQAAVEEEDHLAWSAQRMRELGGRPSLLNGFWYAGSFAMGYAAGKLGDTWNLGFLAETERQVEEHLEGHLVRIRGRDAKTEAVIRAMRQEEAGHRHAAEALGARELPGFAKRWMRRAAALMTSVSYRV